MITRREMMKTMAGSAAIATQIFAAIALAEAADGAAPMTMAFNFNQSTQFGGGFGVTSITQNGFSTGQLKTTGCP